VCHPQIRSVLVSALEASVSIGKDDDREGAAAAESRAQPAAQRILGRVFAECLRVLGNFITVMRLFSTVRPPQSAAILELRRRQGGKGTELQLRQDQVSPSRLPLACSQRQIHNRLVSDDIEQDTLAVDGVAL